MALKTTTRAIAVSAALFLSGAAAAAPTAAQAAVCVAAKVTANGVVVPGTRTRGERVLPARACRVALRRCRNRFPRRRGVCRVLRLR